MKKLLSTLIMMLLIPCSAYASPLEDYTLGKTAIDLSLCPSLDGSIGHGYAKPLEGRSTVLDLRATTGLGGKYAIQYRRFNPESEEFLGCTEIYDATNIKLDWTELNLLYRLDNRTSMFIGQVHAQPSFFIANREASIESKKINQIGLVHDAKITKDTHLYAIVGLGDQLVNFEVGASYQMNKNVDFNVNYREVKVDSLNANVNGVHNYYDIKFKGIGFGTTLKF